MICVLADCALCCHRKCFAQGTTPSCNTGPGVKGRYRCPSESVFGQSLHQQVLEGEDAPEIVTKCTSELERRAREIGECYCIVKVPWLGSVGIYYGIFREFLLVKAFLMACFRLAFTKRTS